MHPRTKYNDGNVKNICLIARNINQNSILGSKLEYSTSPKDEDTQTMHEAPSSPLDLKEMERSFELEI